MLALLVACALFLACSRGGGEPVTGAAPDPHPTVTSSQPHVIIIVIDGPRYSETFGDPLHAQVSRMWNSLRPLGTVCTNFRNLGDTTTNPGHGTLLSGVWQHIDDSGILRIPTPTLFEYYRKGTGAPLSDALLVGGKEKLDAVAYSTSSTYGAAYAATSDVTTLHDMDTYDHLIQHLDQDAPRLVMCSLSDVDQAAHGGDWNDYLYRINLADSLIAETWNHVQADPEYAGKTYLFVTADHGRHDDAHGGFKEHGDGCDGCRHIIFLALGPGIRANQEIDTAYNQRDLCRTVGRILNIPTPQSGGLVMQDLFNPVLTGVLSTSVPRP
jgi:hypothetical protein